MKYRVLISDKTFEKLGQYLDYLEFEKQAPLAAEQWAKKALANLSSLREYPHRCQLAPENDDRDYEIRMMIVHPCLFLYHINDQDRVVRILTLRHGSQEPSQDDLPDVV